MSNREGPETISELRALFRGAESKGARLRLLLEAGHDLSAAVPADLDAVLALAAQRAAVFAGHAGGFVSRDPDGPGIRLQAPGGGVAPLGRLVFEGRASGTEEPEDRAVLDMVAQWMAVVIDRCDRESERAALISLLQTREQALETVMERLFSGQEEERRRLSHDLHDGVAQTAGAVMRQIEACSADLPQDSRDVLEPAVRASRQLIQELRAIIAGLRPTALDDLGLSTAIDLLASSLRDAGYLVEIDTPGPGRWAEGVETAFYRVAQEAFANIRKHTDSGTRVRVTLQMSDADYRLDVSDEGGGFDLAALAHPGTAAGYKIGLQVMRERIQLIGGQLTIAARPGLGTRITAVLPRARAA